MTAKLPVGIYVRLSEVRPGEEAVSLKTQEADARALAERKGWRVVDVYKDSGRSAWADGRERPAFDRMIGDLEARRISGIVAWKQDRLGRRVAEVADLLDRCRRANAVVATVTDGLDTTTPSGRMAAQVVAAAAELESSNTSTRVRRAMKARADRGDAHGGPRPYGYLRESGTLVIERDEAATIRDCMKRVFAGEPVGAVVRFLRDAEVPTSTGGRWTRRSLVMTLTSARIAGRRQHEGREVPGSWEPIVSAEELEALRMRLAPSTVRRARPRSYYLSGGLLICDRCGARLKGRSWAPKDGRGRRAQYACAGSMDHNGCGGLGIAAEPLEEFVGKIVIRRLASPEFRARIEARKHDQGTDDLFIRLTKLDRAADELASSFGAGEIDRRSFKIAKERNALERQSIESELRGTIDEWSSMLLDVPSNEEDLLGWWADAPVATRHALTALVIGEPIRVKPAVRGRRSFDPGRLGDLGRLDAKSE